MAIGAATLVGWQSSAGADTGVALADLRLVTLKTTGAVPSGWAIVDAVVSRGAQPVVAVTASSPTTAGSVVVVRDGGASNVTIIGDSAGMGAGADRPAISPNGRFVAWQEARPNAIGLPEVRLGFKDRVTGSTTYLTGYRPDVFDIPYSISETGRFVTFTSSRVDLVAGDTNGTDDVFVWDRTSSSVQRVSVRGDGSQRNAISLNASATPNGRYIAYTIYGIDPGSGGTSSAFRYDTQTGSVVALDDLRAGQVSISDDGRHIAYSTGTGVYVRDVTTGTTEYVGDVATRGLQASGARISPDGRYVLFGAPARNAVPGASERNEFQQWTYVYDRSTDTLGYAPGPIDSFQYTVGFDGSGRAYFLATPDTTGNTSTGIDLYSARIVPFTDPPASQRAGFVPVDATRVGARIHVRAQGRAYADFSGVVPAGATAVAVNVTVTTLFGPSYVSVCPSATPIEECVTTSTINPVGNRDAANLAVPRIGPDRTVQIYNSSRVAGVDIYLDVIGYFTPAPDALDFLPRPPARDNETPTLGNEGSTTLTVDGVPSGATAVAVRLTLAGVTGNTYLSACSAAVALSACRRTSVLNARQRDTSNLTIIRLPTAAAIRNKILLYNNVGSAIVYADVVGFFVAPGEGSRYVAIDPQRSGLWYNPDPGSSATLTFPSQLPVGTTAVAANITSAGSTAVTYVSVCPAGVPVDQCRRTSTANPYPREDLASTTLVGTGANRDLLYFNNQGAVTVLTDIQGYFVAS